MGRIRKNVGCTTASRPEGSSTHAAQHHDVIESSPVDIYIQTKRKKSVSSAVMEGISESAHGKRQSGHANIYGYLNSTDQLEQSTHFGSTSAYIAPTYQAKLSTQLRGSSTSAMTTSTRIASKDITDYGGVSKPQHPGICDRTIEQNTQQPADLSYLRHNGSTATVNCSRLCNITNLATNLSPKLDNAVGADEDEANGDSDCEVDVVDINDYDNVDLSTEGYIDEGDADYVCHYCGALMWFNERLKRAPSNEYPLFSICCCHGKILVPLMQPPPETFRKLFFDKDNPQSKRFLSNIRAYNNMFCFTSMGGKINHSINNTGAGPYSFVMSGQNYHLLGSLLPPEGSQPVYSQLYIYDTENEISNRISVVSKHCHRSAIDQGITQEIKDCLDKHNGLVISYRMASEILKRDQHSNVNIRLIRNSDHSDRVYDMPTASEVAALLVGDFDRSYFKRDIIVEKRAGALQRIDELHKAYIPLQYPIIFHYGNNGYDSTIKHSETTLTQTKKRKTLTPREYLSFRLMDRNNEQSVLLHSKRLLQQFIVDGYTMVESERLNYIRNHQKELRVDMYRGLTNALTRGETDPSRTGKRIILPSSFTGGARYMVQNYQDAMALCKFTGYPDLFLTFTCNPAWPEVKRFCNRHKLNPADRPDILCRIFKLKLEALMKIIKEQKIFGKVRAEIYTIEFQKRGLPHAHIILFLDPSDKPNTPDDVDKMISAEIPDKERDPLLYDLVSNYMIHGPCGASNKRSPCMKNGKCSKYFPKKFVNQTSIDEEGYPTYRRRNDGKTVNRKGIPLDNRYVVPYNATLLKLFHAHINVEKTNQSTAIKYLFKYVSKGNDRVVAGIYNNDHYDNGNNGFDEISHYLNCRYISSCEGAWRIFSFDIHHRYPSVERLSFHLQDQQAVFYSDKESVSSLVRRPRIKESMFLAWMERNLDDPFARTLTYVEFPQYYTFNKQKRIWKFREKGFAVGRLAHASPSQGEIYYLRVLLTKVKGPHSYEQIRTVDNVVYLTFRSACYALGLIHDDQEFIDAIKEASFWATGCYLRRFFVSMLLCHCISQPHLIWEQTKNLLSEDMFYVPRNNPRSADLNISDDDKQQACLIEIEKLLQINGKSLHDYPLMPTAISTEYFDIRNHLVLQELNFDRDMCQREADRLVALLTDEQNTIFQQVMNAMNHPNDEFFFVYGFGGTGKTFLWKALTASVRAQGGIVINVASSGIAATLLPSGRTAHSRLAIPIDINEDSTCNISQNSPLCDLIKFAKLIIWDEAPMVKRFCIEAVDRTFKDIMKCNHPFGGKCIVMGGDFRQILPVIPKGSRADVINSCINFSHLWCHCKLFQLTKNMRLSTSSSTYDSRLQQFSNWLLDIGDGQIGLPHDGMAEIEIPNDLLILDSHDHLQSIVHATYPDLLDHLTDSTYLTNRAILAPTIEVVEQINDYMCSLLPTEVVEYFSSDSVSTVDQGNTSFQELYTTEFLNTIKCSGLPPHRLALKVGVPIMLMRNIDQAAGLCNGTRLRITFLGKHFIKAIALNGTSQGQEVLIHRMDMNPSESKLPFTLIRRQFPIILSFAMTINKSQGQSMTNVGLYLPRPVFTHGQLYVALSRVRSMDGIKILILDSEKKPTNKTMNVVYREIFQNIV
ncbi:uncharacterized protein LOC114749047 [Neltuma alba]|uniref:uncharacterized protein LOC114749047 n=2 Tax=Neltuma alba TaxID=207710 RepID=UPI0010A465DE|nr:uncharacterized protein LOC114749047 [Prosopis alba]